MHAIVASTDHFPGTVIFFSSTIVQWETLEIGYTLFLLEGEVAVLSMVHVGADRICGQ